MDKRASTIPLEWMIGIVVALLILIPTCLFVSKAQSSSQQAGTNFQDLARELSSFSTSEKKAQSFVLILDPDSSVILFKDKNKELLFEEIVNFGLGEDMITNFYTNYLLFPADKCSSAPCLCLCQETSKYRPIEVKISPQDIHLYNQDVSCPALTCSPLPGVDITKSFSLYRADKEQRRQALVFTKQNNQINVESQ